MQSYPCRQESTSTVVRHPRSSSEAAYLLDTNIVSELRRPRPHPSVVNWINDIPAEQLLVSALTIGEIQAGIEITRGRDPAKARELETRLDERVMGGYDVLAIDAVVFREWARLMHRKRMADAVADTSTDDDWRQLLNRLSPSRAAKQIASRPREDRGKLLGLPASERRADVERLLPVTTKRSLQELPIYRPVGL